MRLFCPICLQLAAVMLALFTMAMTARADEPVAPIPHEVETHSSLVELGKRLFFDSRLSADGSRACSDCHRPDSGGAEPRPLSLASDGSPGKFNALSVYNSRFNFRQTWNGRFGQLEAMLEEHMQSPVVMGADRDGIARLLAADENYRNPLTARFGAQPGLAELSAVLSEFVRALTTPNARFDRWLRGELELSELELSGYRLFKSYGCVSCHNGVNIGGNSYQYLGAVHPLEPRADATDRYALTGDAFDHNRFRVPSLRNVALTAPYLHDGSVPTLPVLLHLHAWHNIGFQLEEAEVKALIAFLTSLTGDPPAILEQP